MTPIDFSKPVQTRDGRKVRILCTDRRHPEYPVIGLFNDSDGIEVVQHWTVDGHYYSTCEASSMDLVQAPQPRKHVELIKRWADDDAVRIKVKCMQGDWQETMRPVFSPDSEYEEILPGDPLY